SWLLLALVLLHFGAAMFHQFIKKDNLLARMWFGK
ncbi:MAG: cytochrome B, partial [Chloroflexi bacterium]